MKEHNPRSVRPNARRFIMEAMRESFPHPSLQEVRADQFVACHKS